MTISAIVDPIFWGPSNESCLEVSDAPANSISFGDNLEGSIPKVVKICFTSGSSIESKDVPAAAILNYR